MDIQICQCCGIIIRGKSKFCTGCGTTISKFSPVTLPVIAHTAAPLAVTLDPDPLVLERTMVKVRFSRIPMGSSFIAGEDGASQTENGGGDSYGHDGGSYVQPQQNYAGPPNDDDLSQAGEAAAASSSRLQNILGNATRSLPAGTGMSGMISLESQEAVEQDPEQGALYNNEAADEPDPAYEPSDQSEFAPPSSYQNTSDYLAPSAMAPDSAVASATNATYASPTRPDQVGTGTVNRIVLAAGAFDALAGSTCATIPVTVTTALSPGLDAGSVVAANLSAAPNVVPITAAEPPAGAPSAASYANATTVVAPQTGSPERIPTGQPAGQSSMPAPPASQNYAEHAPPVMPAQRSAEPPTAAFPMDSAPPAFSPTAGPATQAAPPSVPVEVIPPTAPAGSASAPDFFDSAPQSAAQAPFADAPPVEPAIAASQTLPASEQPSNAPAVEPPPLVVAAPTVNKQSIPAPAAAPFNPVAGGSAGFDFFAPSAGSFAATIAGSSAENKPAVSNDASGAQTGNVLDPGTFGAGVPSVVAEAMRAAASASQTNLNPVGTGSAATDDKPKSGTEEDFPDESVNRGQKKTEGKDEKSDSSSRRKRGLEDDGDDTESSTKRKKAKSDKSDKSDKAGSDSKLNSIENKLRTVFIAGAALIAVLFVGTFLFKGITGILGKATPSFVLAGDWEFGILSPRTGQKLTGTANFAQKGNAFSGIGMDRFGTYRLVNGQLQYPKIQFQKIYLDQAGKPRGKPIVYGGIVDWVNPDPSKGDMPYCAHMYGQWMVKYRKGFGWRGHEVTETGKWEAGQIKLGTPASGQDLVGGQGPNPIGRFIGDLFSVPNETTPKSEYHMFFLKLAIALVVFGVLLVAGSIKMFGPGGLLNIWSKKEYIPSQFKSQHYKMVRELGGALKPGGIPLGWRADWNVMNFWWPRKLALTPELRTTNPHCLILGSGSKGKSRLMGSMIMHDIESNDRAVVVIDSDGGLIDLLMSKIASHPKGQDIARRVIIIDPTHGGDVFAYNPLEYPEDGDLQNAASSVVFGFKAIYTEPPGSQSQWNQQTANILRNSAILLMANGKTLTDLPVLLSENDFRDVLLEKVERLKTEKAEYTTLLEAWSQYKRLARTDQWINWVEPILNRVQPMLGDPRIRPILTKPKGDLNLKEIINEGKILFVKIPQGQLDQNANLLGSLIVTGLKQAAMSLSMKGATRKHATALYLDEFDNFIEKETYDAITSETKKFQIGFIGASKTLQGLPEDYRNQIIINVGTMCAFALAKKDGDMLGPQMFRVDGRKIKYQTLQNIFNKVNTAPQFELISDEEKLNIDRVVGQENRHYFCYRVGTVAGVFNMKAPDFGDVPDKDVNWTLIDKIYARSVPE